MYSKTQPDIKYTVFLTKVDKLKNFKSKTGLDYEVLSIIGDKMFFIRKSSGEKWSVNLVKVHQAYIELEDFKTKNFKPYVPRKQSPALGILITTELLTRNISTINK